MAWLGSALLIVIAGIFLCAALTSLFDTGFYLLELPSHFQLQLFWLGVIFILLIWRILPEVPIPFYMMMALALLINLANIGPWLKIAPTPQAQIQNTESARPITLLQANVFKFNFESAPLLAYIKAQQPDIIVLSEFTPYWERAMFDLHADWPHMLTTPATGSEGMAVFSKLPFEDAEVIFMTDRDIPSYILRMKDERGVDFRLLSIHPRSPMSAANYDNRNQHFDWIAAQYEQLSTDMPLILSGDFNATMYAPRYKKLIRRTGLHNARRGRGVHGTWSLLAKGFPSLPIDHFLHNNKIRVHNFTTGPNINSDHLPTLTEFSIAEQSLK